jgi:hypothetical protein
MVYWSLRTRTFDRTLNWTTLIHAVTCVEVLKHVLSKQGVNQCLRNHKNGKPFWRQSLPFQSWTGVRKMTRVCSHVLQCTIEQWSIISYLHLALRTIQSHSSQVPPKDMFANACKFWQRQHSPHGAFSISTHCNTNRHSLQDPKGEADAPKLFAVLCAQRWKSSL